MGQAGWPAVARAAGIVLRAAVVAGVILLLLLAGKRVFHELGSHHCSARQGAAEHLIDNLTQAAMNYQFDHGVFPPGDGRGSADLVRCLGRAGPRGINYFEFSPDSLAADGSVINPVWFGEPPPRGVIHYRNNLAPGGVKDPPPRNLKSFDLWCAGCGYDPAEPCTAYEVNNWE